MKYVKDMHLILLTRGTGDIVNDDNMTAWLWGIAASSLTMRHM